jgi:hypothetical protein
VAADARTALLQPGHVVCGVLLRRGSERLRDRRGLRGCCPEPCEVGQACAASSHCASGFCHPTTQRCETPTCSDGFLNGLESDVDCGSACPTRCPDGADCRLASDCEHLFCAAGTCLVVFSVDPYPTHTNLTPLVLTGTKVAGSSIQINGIEAVPAGPATTWQVTLNLAEGPNTYEVTAALDGATSAPVPVVVVYDLTPPTVAFTPGAGVFLDGLDVTVSASEPATVYLTRDGSAPNSFSEAFPSSRTLRVFDDTTLTAIARDLAGNWSLAPASARYEITSDGNAWTDGPSLVAPLVYAAAAWDGVAGTGKVYVVGGSDGATAQAGAAQLSLGSGACRALPALVAPGRSSSPRSPGRPARPQGRRAGGAPPHRNQSLGPNRGRLDSHTPMPTPLRLAAFAAKRARSTSSAARPTATWCVSTHVRPIAVGQHLEQSGRADALEGRYAGAAPSGLPTAQSPSTAARPSGAPSPAVDVLRVRTPTPGPRRGPCPPRALHGAGRSSRTRGGLQGRQRRHLTPAAFRRRVVERVRLLVDDGSCAPGGAPRGVGTGAVRDLRRRRRPAVARPWIPRGLVLGGRALRRPDSPARLHPGPRTTCGGCRSCRRAASCYGAATPVEKVYLFANAARSAHHRWSTTPNGLNPPIADLPAPQERAGSR